MGNKPSPEYLEQQNQELKSINEKYKSKIESLEKQNSELEDQLKKASRSLRELEQSEKKLRMDKEFTDYLFHTLREGCLILNKDLRVQSANTAFYNLFQVDEKETEGKLLYELGNNQWDIPGLRNLLEKVLPEKKVVIDYEIEHDFEDIGPRVMLLNARQIDHIQLILLAIEDATERKNAMQDVKTARDTLENRVGERTSKVRELAKRLTGAEQKERNRISAILHDDLQQILTAILMNMNLVSQKMESDVADTHMAEKFSDIIEMTDKAIGKTRQLTGDLNPAVFPPLLPFRFPCMRSTGFFSIYEKNYITN